MAARKRSDPPGDAEKPENIPAARDGSPDEDELARRRAAKGTSVNERVRNGGDDPEPELFEMGSLDGDMSVTLRNLIHSREPVEVGARMGTAAVPIRNGGFFDPRHEVTLLVRVLPGGPVPVCTRGKDEDRAQIEKWKITQPLTPIYVEEMKAGETYSRVQVLELLHEAGVASATVSKLLGEDPQPGARAGA